MAGKLYYCLGSKKFSLGSKKYCLGAKSSLWEDKYLIIMMIIAILSHNKTIYQIYMIRF